jgi:hypothetical protein
MANPKNLLTAAAACIMALASCRTLEDASSHGFNSGFYKMGSGKEGADVYLDVSEDSLDAYRRVEGKPEKDRFLSVPLKSQDGIPNSPLVFRKQSLDIDITTILMKFRPATKGLPQQFTTDMNIALYAGWRRDRYTISNTEDPLGRRRVKVADFGYDFGFFAGPGTTQVNPFTTGNGTVNEYNGMVVQAGLAGFLESKFASFGIAVGVDGLLGPDRRTWIYNGKPWLGFVVGIALN